MKKISVKKIVLGGLATLSSLVLLISMSFFAVYNPVLPSEASIAGKTAENAFSMMDFKSVLMATDDLKLAAVLLGICSYCMLIAALVGAVYCLLGIFFFKNRTAKKINLTFVIVNMIVAALYLIVSIIVVSSVNAPIKEAAELLAEKTGGVVDDNALDGLLMSTASFWALILQAIVAIGYLVCSKLIRDTAESNETTGVDFVLGETETESRKNEKGGSKPVLNYAEREMMIVGLLRKYKEAYTKGIISIMDFEKKKYVLMFENKQVDQDLEDKLVDALVEYRKLYEEEVINYEEYEKKKLQLLSA